MNPAYIGHGYIQRNQPPHVRNARNRPRRGARRPTLESIIPEPRMSEEDLRTWVLTYELSIEVYICAERFLMNDLKACVQTFIIDQFETAGTLAALPGVLASCKALSAGVSAHDPLLKKVFARVGFLLPHFYNRDSQETHGFLVEHPEVAAMIIRETAERRHEDVKDELPAMDKPVSGMRGVYPAVEEMTYARHGW